MKRVSLNTTVGGIPADWFKSNLLTTGEETLPRTNINSSSLTLGTSTLRLTYFTARKSETTTQIRLLSGGTAAGATPTLVRAGLYSIDNSDNGTLVASFASDTSIFAAANTAYTKSWSSSYAKVANQRYAVGIVLVSGAAAATLPGTVVSASSETAIAPRLGATVNSQTDLPSSFTSGQLSNSGNLFYAAILP